MFPGEMYEHAPVQLGVVRPSLIRAERAPPARPLQDLPDSQLAVLPEVSAEQVALDHGLLGELLVAVTTGNVPHGAGLTE